MKDLQLLRGLSRSQNSEHIKWILNKILRQSGVGSIKIKENKNPKLEGKLHEEKSVTSDM